MSQRPKIGDVKVVDLELHQGADLAFDVEWWNDDEETDALPIESAEGSVTGEATDGTVYSLDLADYATETDGIVTVFVPGSVTAEVAPFIGGRWDLYIVAATGERRKVCEGEASCVLRVGA